MYSTISESQSRTVEAAATRPPTFLQQSPNAGCESKQSLKKERLTAVATASACPFTLDLKTHRVSAGTLSGRARRA